MLGTRKTQRSFGLYRFFSRGDRATVTATPQQNQPNAFVRFLVSHTRSPNQLAAQAGMLGY
jgi:hypothetical protein